MWNVEKTPFRFGGFSFPIRLAKIDGKQRCSIFSPKRTLVLEEKVVGFPHQKYTSLKFVSVKYSSNMLFVLLFV